MCELNRLKFELQMTELKSLRETERNGHHDLQNGYTTKSTKPSFCGQQRPRLVNCSSHKSGSFDGPPRQNGYHNHPLKRPQVISQPSGIGNVRHTPVRGVAADDCNGRSDRWRRNGNGGSHQDYELSQDLADKRLEMLERRYGGERARRAAVVIQRAYRHFAMQRKFLAITATAKAQEKRLSRRFTIESSEWAPDALKSLQDAERTMRSELDQLNKNVNGEGPPRSQTSRKSSRQESDFMNESSLYVHQEVLSPTATQAVDVNTYKSSKDLKYFPSEDSGFGSQDTICKAKSWQTKFGPMKKVPPDIPRRSSSVKSTEPSIEGFLPYNVNQRLQRGPPSLTPPTTSSGQSSDNASDKASLKRSGDNGSLSSVQSSGSDSSLSQSNSDRGTPVSHPDSEHHDHVPTSPVWKRKTQMSQCDLEDKRLSNISENSEGSCHSQSSEGAFTYGMNSARFSSHSQCKQLNKIQDVHRKRLYRLGLNLFNKKPEKGITYLINKGFIEDSPQAVAKFLHSRKGLSKQMIGEYLGNLQNSLCMATLECFATEIDLSTMQVDVALRKFQTLFRMPGEAQKIERLMQVFAQRYCQCNPDVAAKLRSTDTVFVLAFAIIMLNTDLHTAAIKQERRMKLEEFIKNLRGVDDGCDIDREMLEGMYNRIKEQEFKPGSDHVTQVLKVQQSMVGKKPVLALPFRRLVSYCRLYEVPDLSKKDRPGVHQREVFLFNDLLVVSKIVKRNKATANYTFRESFTLSGLAVVLRETPHYKFVLEVRQRVDNKMLITFNARNEHDRAKFYDDLKECILEMDAMENLRIEGELERQKANMRASRASSTAENRDSGVADMELIADKNFNLKPESTLVKTALSNSLLDMHEAGL